MGKLPVIQVVFVFYKCYGSVNEDLNLDDQLFIAFFKQALLSSCKLDILH